MPVVSGSNAFELAEALAGELGWEHHPLEVRRFPDSEGYVRVPQESIEAIRSNPVVVVATTTTGLERMASMLSWGTRT